MLQLDTDALAKLERLNQPAGPGQIRRWQANAAKDREVAIPNPLGKGWIKSCQSVKVRPDVLRFLFFLGDETVFAQVGETARGKPLSAIGLIGSGQMVDLRTNQTVPDPYTAAAETWGLEHKTSAVCTRLLLGHMNFAHQAWNELSPLYETLRLGTVDFTDLPVEVQCESLVDLSRLFPELNVQRACDVVDDDVLQIPVGGMFLSSRFAERVLAILSETYHKEVSCIARFKGEGKLVWVSTRLHNRRLANEAEVLLNVCTKMLSMSPDLKVVLDGFSLPEDYGSEGSRYPKRFLDNANATKALCAELIAGLPAQYRDRVRSLAGISIGQSIASATLTDYYICHHGTQQHKVGWFHRVHGAVHTNLDVPRGAGEWVSRQSERAYPPLYVYPTQPDVREHKGTGGYFSNYNLAEAAFNPVLLEIEGVLRGCYPKRARPMKRADVVNKLLELFDQPQYLEIGLFAGDTFKKISAYRKVGVDPKLQFGTEEEREELHELRSDEFFISNRQYFHVVFIDGLHTSDQALRDLLNATLVIPADGVIVLDDISPRSYYSSIDHPGLVSALRKKRPDGAGDWCGGVYKMVFFVDRYLSSFAWGIPEENENMLVLWRAAERRDPLFKKASTIEAVGQMSFASLLMEDPYRFSSPISDICRRITSDQHLHRASDGEA